MSKEEYHGHCEKYTSLTTEGVSSVPVIFRVGQMPRGLSAVWTHFNKETETRDAKQVTIAKCKHCKHVCSRNTERLRNHLKICKKCPVEVSNLYKGIKTKTPAIVNTPLDIQDLNDGMEFLQEKAGEKWEEFEPYFDDFRNKRRPFDTQIFANARDSLGPWKNVSYSRGIIGEFGKFALKILKISGSSAGIERTFNPVRVIHSRLRRSLGKVTLKKLVYIYWNFRMLRNERLWDPFGKSESLGVEESMEEKSTE